MSDYSKDDFIKWSVVLSQNYPEIAQALYEIGDGMLHDDLVHVERAGDITFTVMCHGEEVD